MSELRPRSKRARALYDDGIHWVSAAVSREFANKGFRYGVWRRLPARDECLRAFVLSDEAMLVAEQRTTQTLRVRPDQVGDTLAVPVLRSESGEAQEGGYGLALKRQITIASKLVNPKPRVVVQIADLEPEARAPSFDRRGFYVARYDGVFEHWRYDENYVPVTKWSGRRGKVSKPRPAHRQGAIVVTRDGVPLPDPFGGPRMFAALALSEQWAEDQIEMTPEEEYIPIRSVEGRSLSMIGVGDPKGVVYERNDYVAWFQAGYGLTQSELRDGSVISYVMPYTMWRKNRLPGGAVELLPLCSRRLYSPEKIDKIDPVTRERKTMMTGEGVMRDILRPIRASSMATATAIIDEIATGIRPHGYLPNLREQSDMASLLTG